MPSKTLYPPPPLGTSPLSSALPAMLRTPLGLALLEIQGAVNLPPRPASPHTASPIGRLDFPASHSAADIVEGSKVHLYVGAHQKLVGEVCRLRLPVGVLRRRQSGGRSLINGESENDSGGSNQMVEDVEIGDIVRFKLFFDSRPEFV